VNIVKIGSREKCCDGRTATTVSSDESVVAEISDSSEQIKNTIGVV
jgi:hypothetical protein